MIDRRPHCRIGTIHPKDGGCWRHVRGSEWLFRIMGIHGFASSRMPTRERISEFREFIGYDR